MHKQFCVLITLATCTLSSYAASAPNPSPKWQPVQVVGFQLDALRNNKPGSNKGIAAAYRFASPSNQAAVGGLTNFSYMLRSGYTDMLTHTSADLHTVKIQGDRAIIRVTLGLPDAAQHEYFFVLVRNRGNNPCNGCWLTDGVIPLRNNAPPPLQSI